MFRLGTASPQALLLSRSLLHTSPSSLASLQSPTPLHPTSLRSFSSSQARFDAKQEQNNNDSTKQESDGGFQWGVGSVLAVTAAIAMTRHYRDNVAGQYTAASPDEASVTCEMYKMLPLRLVSRLWGKMNGVVLPEWAREKVYTGYGKAFGCLMDEVEKPLNEYANLGEFFTRNLKPGSRQISDAEMVSPVDARVLTFGKVKGDIVEQVKGVRYSMGYFLGEPVEPLLKPGRELYQIVLYLAPGDYHGFHSPVDFKMEKRVHVHGHMLSVSKYAANLVPGLFAINERVVLKGTWKGGVMFYSPVAATNVGNISIRNDPEVVTNVLGKRPATQEQSWKTYAEPIEVKKGEEIGFFHLGSTIVMVFESEKDFEFLCKKGEKVRLGQPLGVVGGKKPSSS